jgi:DNA-binding transcriptional LysR family regulator
MAGLILPAVHRFRLQNPLISVHYLASPKVLKLEYGEAHFAVRSGPKPEQSDNVAQPFFEVKLALYARESYVARRGLPAKAGYGDHTFACWQNKTGYARVPFTKWIANNVPACSIALHRAPIYRGASGVIGYRYRFVPDSRSAQTPRIDSGSTAS